MIKYLIIIWIIIVKNKIIKIINVNLNDIPNFVFSVIKLDCHVFSQINRLFIYNKDYISYYNGKKMII